MSGERLRDFIIEKRGPHCDGEPNVHAVANSFGAFLWDIFEADDLEDQQRVLGRYGYEAIEELREDAAELIGLLWPELNEIEREAYFKRFGELRRPVN